MSNERDTPGPRKYGRQRRTETSLLANRGLVKSRNREWVRNLGINCVQLMQQWENYFETGRDRERNTCSTG
jgi:hypothetical protein